MNWFALAVARLFYTVGYEQLTLLYGGSESSHALQLNKTPTNGKMLQNYTKHKESWIKHNNIYKNIYFI